MEAFLAQLGDGAGGESEEELNRLLESMMSQLMSKDVLYEPLKDLQDKVCFLYTGYVHADHNLISAPSLPQRTPVDPVFL